VRFLKNSRNLSESENWSSKLSGFPLDIESHLSYIQLTHPKQVLIKKVKTDAAQKGGDFF
jgi:hypothetical protein